MNSILKIYLGIFMMLCMTALSIGLLDMFVSVLNVQNIFQEVVETLSVNDYDSKIMESSMETMKQNGGEIQFTLYDEDGNATICFEPEMIPVDMSQIDLVKVEVLYPYGIGNLKNSKKLRLSGYVW